MSLKLGTRRSELALVQFDRAKEKLDACGIKSEKVIISTRGDREADIYIREVDGIGVFEKEIDSLVYQGDLDGGVHSMKDIPSDLPGDIEIVSVLERKWPRDLLVSLNGKELSELPEGATVGTSSVRRRAQLLSRRTDLRIENLRGNVDTRLEKLKRGDYDAIVLAEAGLKRLGAEGIRMVRLPTLPAANQGAIAVTAREGSAPGEKLSKISHEKTFRETALERIIIEKVGGGCDIPLGVLVELEKDGFRIRTKILSEDGSDELGIDRLIAELNAEKKAELIGEEISQWREQSI
jgi:hydroxymethylbilane synthase